MASPPLMPSDATVVIIPIKTFADAKHRLSSRLSSEQRMDLAQSMARHVLRASAPFPVLAVVQDEATAQWVRSQHGNHEVVTQTRRGLNGAVLDGLSSARAHRYRRAIIVHADLPFLTGLARFDSNDDALVVLGPDRRCDGTNVMSVPLAVDLVPAYGPGSFARHLAAATELGVSVEVIRAEDVESDVDTPDDLTWLDRA